jgi:hypothetical protein
MVELICNLIALFITFFVAVFGALAGYYSYQNLFL